MYRNAVIIDSHLGQIVITDITDAPDASGAPGTEGAKRYSEIQRHPLQVYYCDLQILHLSYECDIEIVLH